MRIAKFVLVALTIALLPMTDVWATIVKPDEPLTVGVFPRRNAKVTFKMFRPMVEYLAQKLDRKVVIETTKDFPSFWHAVRSGRYHLVHYNQFHYVKSHNEFGYNVILKNVEQGYATISSAIFVRADSGINRIEDLRGKKIVFGGGHSAMVSYIGTKKILREAKMFTGDYEEKMVKLPTQAILAAYYGQADAAGSADVLLPNIKNTTRIDGDGIKMIAKGVAQPHLPWAVSMQIDKVLSLKIQQALLELNDSIEGKNILKYAKLSGLRRATDKEYDYIREIIKEVLNEEY